MKTPGYSLENAQAFGWASLTGDLNQARVEYLQKHLVGTEILDAGCGGGGYVKFLHESGLNVTGIDKFDEFLQVAREQDPNGTYFQGDITQLPFEDKSFDFSFSFDVLEHVDDRAALAELVRVTRKRVLVVVPRADQSLDPHGITLRHYIDHTHLRYYTEDSLRTLAESISPHRVEVYPELPVDFRGIFQQIAQFKPSRRSSLPIRALKNYYLLRQLASQIARRQPLRLGVARHIVNQKTEQFLKTHVMDHLSFPEVHTGVVAVIDLEKI